MGNYLRITCHLLGISLVRDNGLLSSVARDLMQCSTSILHISSNKITSFFYLGPAIGRSLTISVQHDLITPLSALLAPPVSSPCLDGNGGIALLEIG